MRVVRRRWGVEGACVSSPPCTALHGHTPAATLRCLPQGLMLGFGAACVRTAAVPDPGGTVARAGRRPSARPRCPCKRCRQAYCARCVLAIAILFLSSDRNSASERRTSTSSKFADPSYLSRGRVLHGWNHVVRLFYVSSWSRASDVATGTSHFELSPARAIPPLRPRVAKPHALLHGPERQRLASAAARVKSLWARRRWDTGRA